MCLAVPVRVLSVEGTVAEVDVEGNRVRADLSLLDDVAPGEYVILHAGFAIQKFSPEEAQQTLDLFRAMARAEEEGAP